jgi:hypothetical protein
MRVLPPVHRGDRIWAGPNCRPQFTSFVVLSIAGCAILRASDDGGRTAPEGLSMEMPKNISTLIWSAVGGAVLTMAVGFTWGGWVTGGTASKDSASAVRDAVIVALAPICVDRFKGQTDAALKITELSKASSWDRGNLVVKSGFATMPGAKDADSDVARACAEILANPPTPKT